MTEQSGAASRDTRVERVWSSSRLAAIGRTFSITVARAALNSTCVRAWHDTRAAVAACDASVRRRLAALAIGTAILVHAAALVLRAL